MKTSDKPTITLTFTPLEAEWLRQALALASHHETRPNHAQWQKTFAIGLDTKIESALKN